MYPCFEFKFLETSGPKHCKIYLYRSSNYRVLLCLARDRILKLFLVKFALMCIIVWVDMGPAFLHSVCLTSSQHLCQSQLGALFQYGFKPNRWHFDLFHHVQFIVFVILVLRFLLPPFCRYFGWTGWCQPSLLSIQHDWCLQGSWCHNSFAASMLGSSQLHINSLVLGSLVVLLDCWCFRVFNHTWLLNCFSNASIIVQMCTHTAILCRYNFWSVLTTLSSQVQLSVYMLISNCYLQEQCWHSLV